MEEFEGYNGVCPSCGLWMVQKWSSRPDGSSQEGCPWCGLACGTGDGRCLEPLEVWKELFISNRVFTIEQLQWQMQSYSGDLSREQVGPFYPSIFNYAGIEPAELENLRYRFPSPQAVRDTLQRLFDAGELELAVCIPTWRSDERLLANHEACFDVEYLVRLAGERHLRDGMRLLETTSLFSLDLSLASQHGRYSYSPQLIRAALCAGRDQTEQDSAPEAWGEVPCCAEPVEAEPEAQAGHRTRWWFPFDKLRGR